MCFASSVASAICSASKLRRRRSCLVVMVFSMGVGWMWLVGKRIQDRLAHGWIRGLSEGDQAPVRILVGARRPLEERHHVALEVGALLVGAEQRDHDLLIIGERIQML